MGTEANQPGTACSQCQGRIQRELYRANGGRHEVSTASTPMHPQLAGVQLLEAPEKFSRNGINALEEALVHKMKKGAAMP